MDKTTCREAVARLYEYLDGELTPESAEAVRRHFELCKRCYPHLSFCQAFQDALRRAARGQPGAPEHLRRKLAELLRAHDRHPDRDPDA
ncbi:MAG TPA: zf-HC2 domain-containing protein [Longimicrobiales bacterium]